MAVGAAQGIGMAANVVGGVLQMVAAHNAKQRMEKAFREELVRQNLLRSEAGGVLAGHLPLLGAEEAERQITKGAGERTARYNQLYNVPLSLNQPKGFGPTTRDAATFGMEGANRARLGGYSDWQLDQMVKKIRAQDELNRISSFARGWADVFPYRMQDAQHSYDQLAAVGNLISSIGGGAQGWGELFGLGQRPQGQREFPSSFGDFPAGFGSQYEGVA